MVRLVYAMAALLIVSGCDNENPPAVSGPRTGDGFYAFSVEDIDGKPVLLSAYQGKVVLVVNVASKCGFTRQYDDLQELYERYRDRGFVVLGFPANNFGNQEPGSNEEIKSFCTTQHNVTFPMFSKISVLGDDIHPLYAYLTDGARNNPHGGAIQWNFTKFLIGKDGLTLDRFGSRINPQDAAVVAQIEAALQMESF